MTFLKEKPHFKGSDHFVIIGWNERSKEIIHSLISEKKLISIALIDETLSNNPLPNKSVHFIQGSPNLDNVLIKANIAKAQKGHHYCGSKQRRTSSRYEYDSYSIGCKRVKSPD